MDLQLHHQPIALHFSFLTTPWLRYAEILFSPFLITFVINAKIFNYFTERGSVDSLFHWIDTNGYLIHYGTHAINNEYQFFS